MTTREEMTRDTSKVVTQFLRRVVAAGDEVGMGYRFMFILMAEDVDGMIVSCNMPAGAALAFLEDVERYLRKNVGALDRAVCAEDN
jgi:hypothetical protein